MMLCSSTALTLTMPTQGIRKLPRNKSRISGLLIGHDNNQSEKTSIDRRLVLKWYLVSLPVSLTWPGCSKSRDAGDWSTPGLASDEDADAPKFIKSNTGVVTQDLVRGVGDRAAMPGDTVLVDYVVRRANGYFIYSTVEGLSFQPRDIPTGAVKWELKNDKLLPGLVEALTGLKRGGRRRILVPPSMGYMTTENSNKSLDPKMPTFGTGRQLDNHKNEPLVFEVEVINIQ